MIYNFALNSFNHRTTLLQGILLPLPLLVPRRNQHHIHQKKLVFDADSDDGNSTPVKPTTPTKIAVTPKMSRLFGSTSSGQTTTSYFGSMSFLDDQVELDKIFGENPVILGVNPVSGSSSDCLKKAH